MKRNLAIAGAVLLIVGLIAINLAMRTDPEPELEPMNGRGPRFDVDAMALPGATRVAAHPKRTRRARRGAKEGRAHPKGRRE